MDPPLDRSSNGVILKPCFRNRRSESSVHLKNSFPGGFKPLPASKSLASLEYKLNDSLTGHSMSQSDIHHSTSSYMNWAKGSQMCNDDFDDSHVDDKGHLDPHATMAGPYYYDMMRAKREEAARKMGNALTAPIDPNSCLVSIESHEMLMHTRDEISKATLAKKSHSSPPKKRVYHAPSSLPTFNPHLNNSKILLNSNSLTSSTSAVSAEYEQWLADRRSNNDSRAWTIRGNQPDINYSAYDFSGKEAKFCASAILNLRSIDDSEENSINSRLQRLGSPQLMAVRVNQQLNNLSSSKLPSLVLPPLLNVEIYTLNHVVKSKSLQLNNTQFIGKQIPSTMTLDELKQIVIREIVLGIEKAFRITEQEICEELKAVNGNNSFNASNHNNGFSSSSSNGAAGRISALSNRQVVVTPIDTKQIQLDFQYFNPAMQSWRECGTEFDWLAAKQAIVEHYCSLNNNESTDLNMMSGSTVSVGATLGPTIQLMHSLEKNSEFLLLQQIQKNYKSRRELMKLRESQVSLDNLTRRLAYPNSSAATNNSRHKFQEVTVPSYQLQLHHSSSSNSVSGVPVMSDDVDTNSRPSRSRGSNRPTSSNLRRSLDGGRNGGSESHNNMTVLKKAVLYPRVDPSVFREREEQARLAEKQQQIAIALQNRLVKTKF